ncbi:ALG1, chitobiosyldiphosphodolichol beta-mannosyltransferase [Dermacentor variabilis]|uniref:ALG1, chitobiosyldiphosphodolichol beta-mannosyltransferase n=1 Tax=Dermacentor variabilis TaxID=34621 RepID=UPI003F5BFDA1
MTEDAQRRRRVAVVVLGDFGRSPRMNYHALSLAKERLEVDVVAYSGSKPGPDVLSNPHIHLHLMREPPGFQKYVPRLVAYILKVLWQSLALFFSLMFLPKPSHVLVQNPPSVPTLPVVWFCCLLKGSAFVVDWHNYGYSILALALGPGHLLVRICLWCEKTFGKKAKSAFCVSQAMQLDLESNWKVQADVLYDKPSSTFQPTGIEERHALFQRLATEYPELAHTNDSSDEANEENIFTQAAPGSNAATLRPDRPALIVSSTSWTEDEDFSVLLDALKEYSTRKEQGDSGLPDLFCIITGKGPQKEHYLSQIHANPLAHVKFLAPWLSAQDYPKMLGSADLGVCLHTSSSKLDLPMKVVDMFGCGLPVCAIDYPCLRELVKPGETGLVFETSSELCQQICDLLQGFPKPTELLGSLRANVQKWQAVRWDDNWRAVALSKFCST